MIAGKLGQIITPAAGNAVIPGVRWCADNAAFAGRYPGDTAFVSWQGERTQFAPWCRFVCAPDVVRAPDGSLRPDAAATLATSAPVLPLIRALGFPAALVAQNGLEDLTVPWDTFDVLFLGGDTAWKEGPAAAGLAREAKARGKRVHMGRVNSLRRLRRAVDMGCDSADGTYLAFGPHKNLPTLLYWLRALEWDEMQPSLFDLEMPA